MVEPDRHRRMHPGRRHRIAPETPGLNLLPQIAVGHGNKLHLDLTAARTADAVDRVGDGQLDIGVEVQPGSIEIAVRGQGQKIVLDEELRAALSGQLRDGSVTSRSAAAWMTRQLVEKAGGQMMLSAAGEPALVFGAMLPSGH